MSWRISLGLMVYAVGPTTSTVACFHDLSRCVGMKTGLGLLLFVAWSRTLDSRLSTLGFQERRLLTLGGIVAPTKVRMS